LTDSAQTELRRFQRRIGLSAEAVLAARGDARRLQRLFVRSNVPMVLVDCERRYVDANRSARLWFRLTRDELRTYALGELAPADQLQDIEREWARLLEAGCLAGQHVAVKPDGSRINVTYYALARVLPELHVVVFAPADWPIDELATIEQDGSEPAAQLTPREIEVLTLAADGLGGKELAEELVLSPGTVNTHFKHIYEKLGAPNRAAAVAKAMRLGLIE
jgi:ATP/maltotriose-dependent transcriptional regulator MalT